MKKYNVYYVIKKDGGWAATKYLLVDAVNETQARKIAEKKLPEMWDLKGYHFTIGKVVKSTGFYF